MTPQEEADSLPTHPLLGVWKLCNCGSPSCRRVTPTRIGMFYQGTGFDPDEARELVAAMKKPRGVK
jgi:hypothetical protein